MTEAEFTAMKATFPWRMIQVAPAELKVVDKNGFEVSLLAMGEFLEQVTTKIARQAQPQPTKEPA